MGMSLSERSHHMMRTNSTYSESGRNKNNGFAITYVML